MLSVDSHIIDIPFANGAVYREDLRKQYFVGPGASILTKSIQPDVVNLSTYQDLQHGMQDAMHDVLHDVAKSVSTWRRKAKVVLAKPKSWESIRRNMIANASYFDVSRMDTEVYQSVNEGLIATVLDIYRGSIFVDGFDQAIALGEVLTPKNDPKVVSVQDGWTQRHVINNLPRQQIIYNLGDTAPGTRYYGEIMVFPKEMEKCYKDTRPMYATEQQLTNFFNDVNCRTRADLTKASKMYGQVSRGRIAEHERIRRLSGIDRLIVNIEKDVKFYLKSDETGRDQYFYTMPDMYQKGKRNALCIAFEDNVNISDPTLLKFVDDKGARTDGSVIQVPLLEFRESTAKGIQRCHQQKFGRQL